MRSASSARRSIPATRSSTRSTVIGLKENSNRETGIVYVRSVGRNQRDEVVLDYVRWVMVRKRDQARPAPDSAGAGSAGAVAPADFYIPAGLQMKHYDRALAGSPHLLGGLRRRASASTMSTA